MRVGKAFLLVRASVPESGDRAAFDHWYATDHLRAAVNAFAAIGGRRFWSQTDPAIHYALYEFPDMATLRRAMDSEKTKALLAEFDRAWGARASRTREFLEEAGQESGE